MRRPVVSCSVFSFLDGVSHPEQLVEEATRAGLDAIALTDHDGMYGVVRSADAARELGVSTVFGSELSLDLPGPQNGVPDPEGRHLLLLARGMEGYRRMCRVISNAHLRGGEKGRPVYDLDEVETSCGVTWSRLAVAAKAPSATPSQPMGRTRRIRSWRGCGTGSVSATPWSS